MRVTTGTTKTFSGVTYEKLVSVWIDGMTNLFTLDDANDRLVYTGLGGMFLMNGFCDFSTDKACTVSLGMYYNGSLITGAETLHTFTAPAKVGSVSICRLAPIAASGYLEVFVKVDDQTATLTFNALGIVVTEIT